MRADIEAAAQIPARRWCRRRRSTVWPQVAAAFGAEVWLKHENHTPIGAFKARSAAIYFRKLLRARARLPRRDHRDARQSRPGGRACGAPLQTTRDRLRAARQQRGEERRDARARRRRWSSTARTSRRRAKKPRASPRSAACTWCRRSTPTSCSASTTYWAELFRAAPDLDVVYVPIGQGSGIVRRGRRAQCLFAAARRSSAWCRRMRRAFRKSFAARRVVESPVETVLGDGMACRKPDRGGARPSSSPT